MQSDIMFEGEFEELLKLMPEVQAKKAKKSSFKQCLRHLLGRPPTSHRMNPERSTQTARHLMQASLYNPNEHLFKGMCKPLGTTKTVMSELHKGTVYRTRF